ncbi:MAG: hypothetical protein A2Z83_04540 [Omnitrophica bacterium GWA2_52_8]|nr:MAG: hypothetical protein A2Z83_04540 [Omnitrophica bacterium GWA2_52_8]
MKNPKQNAVETDAARERTASESEKLRRNQKVREKGAGLKSRLPGQHAAGLNEKEKEDEMEDLYREEENRGTVEAA